MEPIPIFSPIDEIRGLDDLVLGDYNFVDKDISIEHAARYARMLPYSGIHGIGRHPCSICWIMVISNGLTSNSN